MNVRGAGARPRTPTYKVTDGYIGEGQVSYAGINAVAKAKLAAEIVQARLQDSGHRYSEARVDLSGMSSLHGAVDTRAEPYEVRLRIAARTDDAKAAESVGFETRALHVNGPAGGGGGSVPVVRKTLAVQSVLISRTWVDPQVHITKVRYKTRVYDIAHGRAGDKGDTSNISVIAYDAAGWEILQKQLTVECVQKHFTHVLTGSVRRYELPNLQALNFVLEGALGGNVPGRWPRTRTGNP